MGRNIHTAIVYGYSIGGREEWQFEEYDENEYRVKWPEWVELDAGQDEPDEPDDFISQAQGRLLSELTGFKVRTDYDAEWPSDYYTQKRAAEKRLGIEFALHGVGDYTEWVMGFELAYSGESISELDPELIAKLLNPLNMADMDYRLREAVRVLQLHPKAQAAPHVYLLASYL